MNMGPIGIKVEFFFLALSQPLCSDLHLEQIVNAMHAVENHEPNGQAGENSDVIREIIIDCQKKCAQVLRTPFADSIRNVIAASRKKLATKAALDSEASYQHNQRHLNILIEVLGTWSNIVAQSCEYGFSRSLTRQILSPLYTRILEASLECFAAFKRDKELEQWGSRLLDESAECNVALLDSLVAQVAAFRSMLHRHYCFHYSCFHRTASGAGAGEGSASGANSVAPAVIESMLIVTQEELLQWRELDALYVTMEFGFLQRATQQALGELALLEVEAGVLIPQCVEDVFFVLVKVCERALGTGSEANVFAVGNRAVELLRYTAPEEFERHSVLYRVVCSKAFFRRCVGRGEVPGRALRRILQGGGCAGAASRRMGRTSSSSSLAGSAANSAYSTPKKLAPGAGGDGNVPVSGSGKGVAEGSAGAGYSTPGKALVAAVSQTALGSMLLGTAGRNSNSDGGGGGGDGIAAASDAASFFASSLPSSPALGLFGDAAAASLNSWFADQLSPYLSTAEGGGGEGAEGGGVSASSGNFGGIAMHGTPEGGGGPSNSPIQQQARSRAPLPPSVSSSTPGAAVGYSTPNGKMSSNGSSKPPIGAYMKYNSPPNSGSGKFGSGAQFDRSSSSVPSSQSSALSMEEVLLNALVGEEDSDSEDLYYGTSSSTCTATVGIASPAQCSDGYEFGAFLDAEHSKLRLKEEDWAVQVNTLCTIACSIGTLQAVVAQGRGLSRVYNNSSSSSSRADKGGPIEILLQELRGCQAQYTALLDAEARQLARWTFLAQIQYNMHKFCMMRFDITGQEMEDRAAESVLQGIARRCLGITALERYREHQEKLEKGKAGTATKTSGNSISPAGSAPSSSNGRPQSSQQQQQQAAQQDASAAAAVEDAEEEERRLHREAERARLGTFLFGCGSKLSQGAYVVVLRELCAVLASYLMEHLLLRARFSEWGALLLYQEVIALAQYMEALVDHLDPVHIQTVKATFASLNLALKILTLDAPGDIRRYALSRALLSEEQVRAVLARRIEFPAEAVAKVKLTMVDHS